MCANKKIISILLAVVLVLTSFPFATTAEKTLQESQNFTDGVEYTEDSPEEFTLPDIIKDDDVQAEEKFVVRAQSYETSLNMFVFRNNDGTYT